MARILAVEDEALVRFLIVETLEVAGHTVQAAADGEAALEMVRNSPQFDVLLSDVRMPRMDGYTLALRAREVLPSLGLMFMTGYTEASLPRELSFARTMLKPFSPDDLVAAIDALLSEKAAEATPPPP